MAAGIVTDTAYDGGAVDAGAYDLGAGHYVLFQKDGNLIWHHPACRPWCTVDLTSGEFHQLIAGGPDDYEHLHIEASLLCPMGCETHGYIRDGKWVQA